MSQTSSKNRKKQPENKRIPRKTVIVIGVVLAICIAVIAGVVLTKQGPFGTGASVNTSANTSPSFTSAGALYSKSVDLANAGDYQGALEDANEALAQNISSLTPLIQSNRAGILVALGRYDDAIAAADVAINTPGNLTTLRSIAWYNKANALQALGRSAEADAAYANATALDPTLKHP
jgi:tetratricopeptide (TPR) repeat protein